MQAEWKLEETPASRQIIITSIPYGVNKGKLEEAIGEIIAAAKLPQLLGSDQRIQREGRASASPWTSSPTPIRTW